MIIIITIIIYILIKIIFVIIKGILFIKKCFGNEYDIMKINKTNKILNKNTINKFINVKNLSKIKRYTV